MLVRGTCLYDQVESGIFPHVVEVGQYLVVGDGQHHDEDPQQDHRHEELVDHPHGHHGRLEEVTPLPSGLDTGGQLATGHLVHGESHHELTLHFDKIMIFSLSSRGHDKTLCLGLVASGGEHVCHAGAPVHGLHPALGDGLDVDFLLVPGELLQAVGVEGEVRHCVVVRVTTEWLRKEKFTVSPIFQSATIQILCTILSADGWKDY